MKKSNYLLFLGFLCVFLYSCGLEDSEIEPFGAEKAITIEENQSSTSNALRMSCPYFLGIPDAYIDGTQSGANAVYLTASGSFPSGTTYSWKISRQNGSTQIYPASTTNPRQFSASSKNRITRATVKAEHPDCTKTVSKTFMCPIPCNSNGGFGLN